MTAPNLAAMSTKAVNLVSPDQNKFYVMWEGDGQSITDPRPEFTNRYTTTIDPFHQHRLTLTAAWISTAIHHKVWDEMIYLFPNLNGWTVWEWI